MSEFYRDHGIGFYESVHYSNAEHMGEVDAVLSWFPRRHSRVLDLGCGAGLHALEFARRGFDVTGIDLEPSAIELARKRNFANNTGTHFEVADIADDDLKQYGCFDLAYSIGNVLSHIQKSKIREVFQHVRERLNHGGFFVFDLLTSDPRLAETVKDQNLNIMWTRKLDCATGKIELEGLFLDYGSTQHFEVWGYCPEEVEALLTKAGFADIRIAQTLSFDKPTDSSAPAQCLRYRAKEN